MTLAPAIRLTEIMLGLAYLQQSLEHLHAHAGQPRLFLPRIVLCVLLVMGVAAPWVGLALLLNGLFILRRFQGPYNGGADRMGLLILTCLCLTRLAPDARWGEVFFGYLAAQLVLSYFVSGWVKIVNPAWRRGEALRDVFLFSAYPTSESLRRWADYPGLLWAASWAVMLFELLFPLSLLTAPSLVAALAIGAAFHFANACLFGLNRFFWIWLTAYPSLIWLQACVL